MRSFVSVHNALMRHCVAALLCLCASLASASDFGWEPDIKPGKRYPAHMGFAAVHVVDNFVLRFPDFKSWTGLTVKRTDKFGRSYNLEGNMAGLSSGQVFAGALPAGDYQVQRVSYGDAYLPPSLESLGVRFRVERGRFTDVGSVAVNVVANARRKHYVVVTTDAIALAWSASNPGLLGWLHAVHPELSAIGPASVRYDVSEKAFVSANAPQPSIQRQTPVLLYSATGLPHLTDDGTTVFPARFGSLRIRSPQGQWGLVDTGLTVNLNAVAEYEGQLVIGGDRGTLRVQSGQDWQPIVGVGPDESVYAMRATAGGLWVLAGGPAQAVLYQVDIAHRSLRQHKIFGKRDGYRPLKRQRLSLLQRSFLPGELGQGRPSGIDAVRPAILVDNENLLVGMGERRWALESGSKWSTYQEEVDLATAILQPNGRLIGLYDGHSNRGNFFVSSDGRSWRRLPGYRTYDGFPYAFSDGAIGAIVPDRAGARGNQPVGNLKVAFELRRDADVVARPLPPACRRLLGTASTDELLLVECRDLTVLRSVDRGQSWHVDWRLPTEETDS